MDDALKAVEDAARQMNHDALTNAVTEAATLASGRIAAGEDAVAVGDAVFGAILRVIRPFDTSAPLQWALPILGAHAIPLYQAAELFGLLTVNRAFDPSPYIVPVQETAHALHEQAKAASGEERTRLLKRVDQLDHAAYLIDYLGSLEPTYFDARVFTAEECQAARHLLETFAGKHGYEQCVAGATNPFDEGDLRNALLELGAEPQVADLLVALAEEYHGYDDAVAALALRQTVEVLGGTVGVRRFFEGEYDALDFFEHLLRVAVEHEHPEVGYALERLHVDYDYDVDESLDPLLDQLAAMAGRPRRKRTVIDDPGIYSDHVRGDELFIPAGATALSAVQIVTPRGKGGFRCYVRAVVEDERLLIEPVQEECPAGWDPAVQWEDGSRDGVRGTTYWCGCARSER